MEVFKKKYLTLLPRVSQFGTWQHALDRYKNLIFYYQYIIKKTWFNVNVEYIDTEFIVWHFSVNYYAERIQEWSNNNRNTINVFDNLIKTGYSLHFSVIKT